MRTITLSCGMEIEIEKDETTKRWFPVKDANLSARNKEEMDRILFFLR